MQYDNFPWISSNFEVIWQGIVKVDSSILEHVSSTIDEKDGYKLFIITDSNYNYDDNAQLDNIDGSPHFPNKVTLLVKEELVEYMNCLAVKCYLFSESKGLFKKHTTIKKTITKGFILQPIECQNKANPQACLASIQFDNEQDRSLTFRQQGLSIFTSGSQSSKITIRNPHRSVTTVFIASDDNPFIADVHTKNKILKFIYDTNGIKIEETMEEKTPSSQSLQSSSWKEDSVQILKIRLSKGEITIGEYQKLKKTLEDERPNTSFYWI